jgi:hypothetical protein
LQFRDEFYPSHIEVSKSHFAAMRESGIGTKLPNRNVRSAVAFEGKAEGGPDVEA